MRQSSACRQKLDRLNQGHEQVREALTAGRAELNALHDTPELLDKHDRAGEIARQVAWSERLFEEAERLITADPIGTQELIVRVCRNLEAAIGRPREQPRSPREVRPTYPSIDDLSASFNQLRQAATELFRTSFVSAFVRGWMLFWVLGLMLVFFTPFLPLTIVLLGFLVILAGFWTLWRIVASWFWFGMWQKVALRRGGCVAKTQHGETQNNRGRRRLSHGRWGSASSLRTGVPAPVPPGSRSQVMPPLQIQLRKGVIPKHLRLSDVPSKYIDTRMARLLLN